MRGRRVPGGGGMAWAGDVSDARRGAPERVDWRLSIRAAFEAEQERWFLWLPVFYGLGISAYMQAPAEPTLVAAGALLVLAATVARAGLSRGVRRPLGIAIIAVAAGFACAKIRSDLVAAPVLTRMVGPVEITGFLELVEPRVERGQRLTLRVVTLGELAADGRPYRVRVRTLSADPGLAAGMAVRLRATVGPPPPPAYPGDFDFGRLAWFSALGGVGFAAGAAEPLATLGTPPVGLALWSHVERLRQAIRARVVAVLPGQTGEIATALITGERGGISAETNQAYRDSGLFHILSISGLHMVIMAGAVFWLLRLAMATIPPLALARPIKSYAAAGAIVGAFGYLLISGMAPATVRSYVMITIMFAAVILERPALALRNVALAALVILAAVPESLFDAGFQMSFAAVTGLVAAFEAMRRAREADVRRSREAPGRFARLRREIGQILLSTIIASLAVAPFGIYHFHNTQMLSLIANVLAVPVCNVLVMPAALGVLIAMPLGLEAWPLHLMGAGIDAMTAIAASVGALPGAVVKVPAIPTLAFAAFVIGGLWLLLWSGSWRILGLVLMTLGLMAAPGEPRPDVIVGRDGTTIAVRGPDGRLSALTVRGSSFELGRWLERDGDARTPAEASDARAFTCDGIGCTARVGGRVVAVAFSAAALGSDCRRVDVLVTRFEIDEPCRRQPRAGRLVVTPRRIADHGVHALTFGTAGVIVATVRGARGARPWSGARAQGSSRPQRPSAGLLAGIPGLFERFGPPAPSDAEETADDVRARERDER